MSIEYNAEVDQATIEMSKKFFEVSEILYNNDPAGTMCKENYAETEYDSEAFDIVALSEKELSTVDSVLQIFENYFDGYYDPEIIKNIFPTIKRIVLS